MAFKWVWFATVLGIATALPTTSHRDPEELMRLFQPKQLGRNNAIETLIIEALEDFRQTMITGSDSIPVLDPLQVERIFIDDSTVPIPGAHIDLENLVVRRLSTFDLTEVSVATTSVLLQRYQAVIQGEIPRIEVEVDAYDLSLDVMGANIFGKGDAKITVIRPWLKIDAGVNIRLGILAMYLNINSLRLDFGLDDIEFGLTGMFNSTLVDDFINKFLRNLIMEFAEFWTDDISDFLSPNMMDVANGILRDINLIDFLTNAA